MRVFTYIAKGADGLEVRGSLKAFDSEDARATLLGRGFRIRMLAEMGAPDETPAPAAPHRNVAAAVPPSLEEASALTPGEEGESAQDDAAAEPARELKRFSYHAAGDGGVEVRGSLRASDDDDAKRQLEERKLKVRLLTRQDAEGEVTVLSERPPVPRPLGTRLSRLFTYQAVSTDGMELWGSLKADDGDDARALLEGRGLRLRMLNEMAAGEAESADTVPLPPLPASPPAEPSKIVGARAPLRPPMLMLSPSDDTLAKKLAIRPPPVKGASGLVSERSREQGLGRIAFRQPVVASVVTDENKVGRLTVAPPPEDAGVGMLKIRVPGPPEAKDEGAPRLSLRAPESPAAEEPAGAGRLKIHIPGPPEAVLQPEKPRTEPAPERPREEVRPPAAAGARGQQKQFFYQVAGTDGMEMRGMIWAEDRAEAKAILECRGMQVQFLVEASEREEPPPQAPYTEKRVSTIQVEGARPDEPARGRGAPGPLERWREGLRSLAPFTPELVAGYRELAAMYKAGISIGRAVGLLAAQSHHPRLRAAFRECRDHIERGGSLSWAMAKNPGVFAGIYVRLVEAGENSGNLDRMLHRMAEHSEKASMMALALRNAMTYPCFIFVMCMALLVLGPAFALRGIFDFLKELDVPLPMATQVLMSASAVVRSPLTPLIAAVVVGAAAFAGCRLWAIHRVRRAIQAFLMRVPAVGEAICAAELESFSRTLSLLYESGIPLLKAMELAEKTSSNLIIQDAVAAARTRVCNGSRIQNAFKDSPFVPPLLVNLMAAGEQSGRLGSMLEFASTMLRQKLEAALDVLSASLQPLVLIVVGVLVGFVVIATLSPMLKVLEGLK